MAEEQQQTLKAAVFDSNTWYQITEGRVDNYNETKFGSMLQIVSDNGTMAVWPANGLSYWQFNPVDPKTNTNRYALRCETTGVGQQLGVCHNPLEVDNSRTQPCMRPSSADNSQMWDISNWGDGTFRFVNVGNGSDFVLDVHRGNPPYMSSNANLDVSQEDEPAQRWLASSISKVNNIIYSTTFGVVSFYLLLPSKELHAIVC